MKEFFENRKTSGIIRLNLPERGLWVADKQEICNAIITIVEDYQEQGYTLTLRQLYYQLVSKDIIWNHDTVYKKISALLDDLRYSGQLDWSAIEDRGRKYHIPYSVDDIEDAIQDTIDLYRLDRQKGQNNIVEVWTEKDAISSILKRITSKYHVKLMVNKGYSSSSAMHQSYQRFSQYLNQGKKVTILYFGDHDPSGLDMLRDIKERIDFFILRGKQAEVGTEMIDDNHKEALRIYEEQGKITPNTPKIVSKLYLTSQFTVKHVGLTSAQIATYNPPPNPAKITDPRAKWYIEHFGNVSYEVDALEPRVMEQILTKAIEAEIDMTVYSEQLEQERSDIAKIKTILKQ